MDVRIFGRLDGGLLQLANRFGSVPGLKEHDAVHDARLRRVLVEFRGRPAVLESLNRVAQGRLHAAKQE
jgi:hypothetical protein